MKINVDGLEDLLLAGAREVVCNRSLRSVLVASDCTDLPTASRAALVLSDAGLTFVEKRHPSMLDDGPFAQTYDQFWECILW